MLSDEEIRERIIADPEASKRVDELVKGINSGRRSGRGITDAELLDVLRDQR